MTGSMSVKYLSRVFEKLRLLVCVLVRACACVSSIHRLASSVAQPRVGVHVCVCVSSINESLCVCLRSYSARCRLRIDPFSAYSKAFFGRKTSFLISEHTFNCSINIMRFRGERCTFPRTKKGGSIQIEREEPKNGGVQQKREKGKKETEAIRKVK